jgi:GLPGLI family protein
MKIKNFILALVATIISITSFSQGFDGKITAKMIALSVPDEMKGMEGMMTQDMIIYSKKEKSRVELKSMMGNTTVISDTVKKESIVLMDMMGQKTAIKQPLDENTASGSFGFEVQGGTFKATSETKTIAGYKCTKGVYTMPTEEGEPAMTVDLWYTTSLSNPQSNSDIPGMVMEFTMDMEGMKMQFTISAISKETVADSMFEIPAGYTIKTEEEFQNSIPTMGK